MFEHIIQIDSDIFLFLNNLGTTTWDWFWLLVTNIYSGVPVFVFLLYFSYTSFRIRGFIVVIIFILLMITVSDQLSNLFKNILIQRLRPCYNEHILDKIRLVRGYCGGRYGYFSAHASNSFAIASYAYFLFKGRKKWFVVLIILWAVLTSYSRIYIGVHYPSDILTGILVGIVIGGGAYLGVRGISRVVRGLEI